MFQVGDRIRTNRSAAIRFGVITEVDDNGSVLGVLDDGLQFIRGLSMLGDLVLAGDAPAVPASQGYEPHSLAPQPGDHVMVTWPSGRRFGVVHPCGSYIGRLGVLAGAATVQVIEPRS